MSYIGRSPPGHTPVTVKEAKKKRQKHNNQTMQDLDMLKSDLDVPGLRLWGHRIVLDGGESIECEECKMEEEVPEILQMSNGFRQAVYKLYILGKFKHTQCEPDFETDNSTLHTRDVKNKEPDYVSMQNNSVMKMGLDDGDILTDGRVIFESTSDQYYAGDMLTDHDLNKIATQANGQT